MKAIQLALLTAALSLWTVDAQKARLLSGIDPENEIPNQYIAVFKTDSSESIPMVPGASILRTYTVGRRRFALVEVEDSAIDGLLSHPTLEFLEANRWLKVEDPVGGIAPLHQAEGNVGEKPASHSSRDFQICTRSWTNPSINAWGIIRTSSRELPDYAADSGWGKPYVYGVDDAGEGADIYVVDTGIYLEHTDFEGRASFGMVADGVGEPGDVDLHGHGTHVAGTAGGRRYGVAKKAKLISCKVFNVNGSAPFETILQAIEWVGATVKEQRNQGRVTRPVINMSLGGQGFSYVSETAIQEVIEDGITVVTSSGNSAEDACVYTPARVSSAITVGATDSSDNMAAFSNYGPCVDILAPGVSIAGPYRNGTFNQEFPYALLSGTSMASPHVAGIVARYLSSLSHMELQSTSPGLIKAKLNDQATNRLISYAGLAKWPTPNKLLYRGCGDGAVSQPPPPSSTPTTTTTTTASTTTSTTSTTSLPVTATTGKNVTASTGSDLLDLDQQLVAFPRSVSAFDADHSEDDSVWTVNMLAPLVTGSLVLMSISFGANVGTVIVFWAILRMRKDRKDLASFDNSHAKDEEPRYISKQF